MFPLRSTLAGLFVIGVVSACSKNYPPVASLVLGDCEGRTYEPALVHVESKLFASGLNGTVNESGKDHPRPAVLMRTYSIGEPRPDASSNNVVAVVTVTERTARVDILAATGVSKETYRRLGEALIQGERLAHPSCIVELDVGALGQLRDPPG